MNSTRARQSGGSLPAGGFTLIELLVVILIIMCLVGALVPTLSSIRTQILGNNTQTTINMIHGAVRQYWEANNNTYPIGNLVGALTTYTGSVTNDGTIFRTGKGASTYGMDALRTASLTTSGTCFADAFGGPILYAPFYQATGEASRTYHRDGSEASTVREIAGSNLASPTTATMFGSASINEGSSNVLRNRSDLSYGMWVLVNASHNVVVLLGPGNGVTAAGSPVGTASSDLDWYARRDSDMSITSDQRDYYRRDFILVSPGADGAFVDFKINPRSDDKTNFNN